MRVDASKGKVYSGRISPVDDTENEWNMTKTNDVSELGKGCCCLFPCWGYLG